MSRGGCVFGNAARTDRSQRASSRSRLSAIQVQAISPDFGLAGVDPDPTRGRGMNLADGFFQVPFLKKGQPLKSSVWFGAEVFAPGEHQVGPIC